MQAEIIAIGSELTNGEKLDTNSQWLSTELASVGISTHFHTTIADHLDEMVEQLRLSSQRSDLILITGGLGPTLDDLTRQALAELTGVELEIDAESLNVIEAMFQKRAREMPERNRIQAMFPQGSEPISNQHGTAPGIWMQIPRDSKPDCCIAAMPGVPSEMKPMFFESVLPRLALGTSIIRFARINCFGVGESKTEELLGDITSRGRDPEVGITAHEATITLRIKAVGDSVEMCEQKITETYQQIHERIGEYIFGYEDEELEHIVVALLSEKQKTLATAECGTGGLLSYRFTEVAGSEKYYAGGSVLPLQSLLLQRTQVAGESAITLDASDAIVMARTARESFGSDYGLAILLDQSQSWQDKANVPQAYVALVAEGVELAEEIGLTVNRAIAKSRVTKVGLNLLRRTLLALPE